jgi:hypothetical protein
VGEAARFTAEMSRTKYNTFTGKKGDVTNTAVKLANVQNERIMVNMQKMADATAVAMSEAREESNKARERQADDNAKTFMVIQTMQQTLAATVTSAVKSQEQFNTLQATQNRSVNIQMQQTSRQAHQQMAINSSRRKDEAEKDDRDDNVDALRRLIDGLQPAIARLEGELEELLEEHEIDHEEIPAGIKETGHTFIQDHGRTQSTEAHE